MHRQQRRNHPSPVQKRRNRHLSPVFALWWWCVPLVMVWPRVGRPPVGWRLRWMQRKCGTLCRRGTSSTVMPLRSTKFVVLYEARSDTGIDRMKIINAVAKSIPQPHKIDLIKPDRTIIVQIANVNVLI